MNQIIISGTDTDIGKTVFACALTQALKATYWKPVQAGLQDETDTQFVSRLSGQKVLEETYRLNTPASPHIAADIDGLQIDLDKLQLPNISEPLIVEGAGGLMVPLTHQKTYLDIFEKWNKPVVLVARTALGTINHSLLSINALRQRGVPILGIAFVGDEVIESEKTIEKMGQVKRLGRLPLLPNLTSQSLSSAFEANFDLGDFS
ncbi:MAG: dethiobiotin synthase [Nitratireductor sp.]